jgi:C_GCAxxG_C_C family probable redox protein
MKKSLRAAELHDEGFSCSQSVLAVFSEEFGLDEELAKKIATAFGGGIAGREEICGAVSGALMVIGLKFGRSSAANMEAKDNTYDLSSLFFQKFSKLHNSLLCKDLKSVDCQADVLPNIVHERCNGYIRDAVEILEDLLYQPELNES